jgi:tetratricopeptide (TPR) repeat protein
VAGRALSLPADGPTPWPGLDAATLGATATLAAGQPAMAAARFEQVSQTAAAWDARVAARASLFATLGYQLAGDADAAIRTRDAALRAVSVTEVQDPMILRLLIETHTPGRAGVEAQTLRQTRARLARVELERGSPQAALLAWRAAETDPGNKPTRDHLRLGQAEALIALGQDEPAIAMLIGLGRTEVRPEALVMLGLVHMRRGQVEVGLAMLNEAVAGTSAESHAHVYADAGFALLSTGKRTEGQALVREARMVYQARDDKPALRRLLTNQLQYAQAVDDPDLTQQVRQALLDVDQ